jgi:hypothetical protein
MSRWAVTTTTHLDLRGRVLPMWGWIVLLTFMGGSLAFLIAGWLGLRGTEARSLLRVAASVAGGAFGAAWFQGSFSFGYFAFMLTSSLVFLAVPAVRIALTARGGRSHDPR